MTKFWLEEQELERKVKEHCLPQVMGATDRFWEGSDRPGPDGVFRVATLALSGQRYERGRTGQGPGRRWRDVGFVLWIGHKTRKLGDRVGRCMQGELREESCLPRPSVGGGAWGGACREEGLAGGGTLWRKGGWNNAVRTGHFKVAVGHSGGQRPQSDCDLSRFTG